MFNPFIGGCISHNSIKVQSGTVVVTLRLKKRSKL